MAEEAEAEAEAGFAANRKAGATSQPSEALLVDHDWTALQTSPKDRRIADMLKLEELGCTPRSRSAIIHFSLPVTCRNHHH